MKKSANYLSCFTFILTINACLIEHSYYNTQVRIIKLLLNSCSLMNSVAYIHTTIESSSSIFWCLISFEKMSLLCSKSTAILVLFYSVLSVSTALQEFIQWTQIEYHNLPGMHSIQRELLQ